jgi:hypothetical protein
MPYIGLALYAEGPTDYRFLTPLLTRLVEDIYLGSPRDVLELGAMIELDTPEAFRDAPRERRIIEAANDAAGGFHILFVHADGMSRPATIRRQQIEPGLNGFLAQVLEYRYAGVAVVPIREMEAWAIWDGDALRKAFGSTLSDAELGIPTRAREVEREPDPKNVLDNAYAAVTGRRRDHADTAAAFLTLIAEAVDLSKLSSLRAFRTLRRETELAMRSLNLIE